jgi:hypothetical protein
VLQDDHANLCADATALTINGAQVPGRVDGAGDVDFFVVESQSGGAYVLRIDGLHGSTLPRVRITNAATGALVKNVEYDPAQGGYLLSELILPAEGTLCLELSHQSATAPSGHYRIEVGSAIDAEKGKELRISIRGTAEGALVTRTIDWEILAQVGTASAAGTGINRVVGVIYDANGKQVHRIEGATPAWCLFGAAPCAPLDLIAGGGKWPNGAAVQSGEHTLVATVFAADGRSETVMVTVQIALATEPASHAIRGRVTLDGTGLAGVTVSAGGKSATTDAQGDYLLPGFAAGAYTVTPQLQGYAFAPAQRTVTIADADSVGADFAASSQPGGTSNYFGFMPAVFGE